MIDDSTGKVCPFGKIILPGTVMYIDEKAFRFCKNLRQINMPISLSIIGDSAFEDCSQLIGELILPNGLEKIGANAFKGAGITSVKIPSTVTEIGPGAFDDGVTIYR